MFTPLRTHTLDPRTEAINTRRGLGRVEINRRCDQNARAIPMHDQKCRSPEFHMKINVVASQLIYVVVVGDNCDIQAHFSHSMAQRFHTGLEYGLASRRIDDGQAVAHQLRPQIGPYL